jgi:hypothetical protein
MVFCKKVKSQNPKQINQLSRKHEITKNETVSFVNDDF